ncbi:TetR/AcrR family transcriptional regulator [Tenacibaculum sp. S7007]|uniref:TetR/AcrR family transcriptional regulator n=1 Tax=Tenacibaculum pelagium TaxID=2759527 RepID=A0A839AS55_9FLAO|nr:TetR/AcrR family transcriptional regulator [Tenacibaculum pelagium]MBA6157180.1 TetR/AcrR family transcriptional regulator [Tenacibaculum pelagium]
MKNKILEKAGEMFLNYGFKSVTMDDIANELAISKKTLYKYFSNKADLVDDSIVAVQKAIDDTIMFIKEQKHNAIEEEFAVKAVFKEMFKNAKTSPMFQLKKYFPESYTNLVEREVCMFRECNTDNLEKGIEQGLYRPEINKDLVTNFYFTLIFGVFDSDNYGEKMDELMKVEYQILEYHIRAIATKKGIEVLENQLEINK